MPWLAGALAAAGVVAVLVWPGDGRPRDGSRLRVLFTGETLGELEPCNCSGKMAGGLPVRGGYVASRGGEFLLLDTGCIGAGVRDFEVLRLEAALRGMAAMGYDAANIGEHELWLGREGLARLEPLGVPMVSANVLTEAGRPVAAPYRLLRRAGLKVAVTGVVESAAADLGRLGEPTSPGRVASGERARYQAGPGLVVHPPREVLARLLPTLCREAGVIVVLADLDLAAVRDLATDFPEITLILFRGRGDSHAPERVNRTVIASVYGEARYVADVELAWSNPGHLASKGQAVLLDERFAPSPRVAQASIGWYKEAVRGRTFDLAQPGPGSGRIAAQQPDPGNRYVGSAACRGCHKVAYERWSAGPHARAMESLKKAGYEYSPECIVCHTVGYGASDGYVSMDETSELGRVGCEACHGRGQWMLTKDHRGLARPRGDDSCRECHAPKHHPDFSFEKHWAKVRHEEKS